MSRRALLLAGGQAPPAEFVRRHHHPGDLVLAADSGLNLALAAGIPTDLLIGDLDSLEPGLEEGFEVQRHPRAKDASDLELALEEAFRRGAREGVILGALGGRLDHTLFNVVALLEKAEKMGFAVRVLSPDEEVFLAGPGIHPLSDRQGWNCSVLPLDSSARLSLEGLEYPLHEQRLERASTRGLSNRVSSDRARIQVLEGLALILLARPTGPTGDDPGPPGPSRAPSRPRRA